MTTPTQEQIEAAKNLIAQLLETDCSLHDQEDHDLVAAFLAQRDAAIEARVKVLERALSNEHEESHYPNECDVCDILRGTDALRSASAPKGESK
jgi:hypothetical protein